MSFELLLIPTALSIAHIIGFHQTHLRSKELEIIKSYSAGFSISYVFLILFPELTLLANGNSELIWTLLLIGFSLFHVSHKIIFRIKKSKRKKAILKDEVHLITAALYNFLVSFSLVQLFKIDPTRSLIVVLLIIVHTILSEISNSKPERNWVHKVKVPVIICATLIGGLLPNLDPSKFITASLFSFTAGSIIYISIREELPGESHGKAWVFVAGVTTFLVVVNQLIPN